MGLFDNILSHIIIEEEGRKVKEGEMREERREREELLFLKIS